MFPRGFSNKTGKWLPDHGHWMGVLLKWLTGRKFLEVLFYHIAFSTVLNRSVVSNSLRPHGLQPSRLLCPWDSPGTNTGVGCHALLQAQASNPSLLHLLQLQTGSLPLAPPWKPYLFIYLPKFIYSHPPIIINLSTYLYNYLRRMFKSV